MHAPRTLKITLGLLGLALAWMLVGGWNGDEPRPIQSRLVAGEEPAEGFLRAEPGRPLVFPDDHGPHPDYQTEWWYYTGNLETNAGQHFGYQLTFFRRALTPPALRLERDSAWSTDQVYFAHFALTDTAGEKYQAFERFSRGSTGLAGAKVSPFQVWLEDWRVDEIAPNTYQLSARQDGLSIDLTVVDIKGPVLHGQEGYSPKGPETGNASYYYSLTNLDTRGRVTVADQVYQVAGKSWMDHEFSTSALSDGQIGWDWFSIQLSDKTELMVFQLRQEDGTIDPFSSGTLIEADGSTIPLSEKDFIIQVADTWVSPRSSAEYPSRWRITIPAHNLELDLQPYLADQELDVSFQYWEGAVQVQGQKAGSRVIGAGYVEMTGYSESIAGQF